MKRLALIFAVLWIAAFAWAAYQPAQAVCPVIPVRCDAECSGCPYLPGCPQGDYSCSVCSWTDETCTRQVCMEWTC